MTARFTTRDPPIKRLIGSCDSGGEGVVWTTSGHAVRTSQDPSDAAWDRFLAEFRA